MKERILIGEELQIRFRLQGYDDTEVLCDVTRPLGTILSAFEHDSDGEWNRFGLIPLREALHSNRWKQPELEQASGDFLAKQKTSQKFFGKSLNFYLRYSLILQLHSL